MPKITFLPSGKTVEANVGETLLDVALSNQISIQHACGGFCACTTCHCEIESESVEDSLDLPQEDELERLEILDDRTTKSRLACQSKVRGDLTVRIVNHD